MVSLSYSQTDELDRVDARLINLQFHSTIRRSIADAELFLRRGHFAAGSQFAIVRLTITHDHCVPTIARSRVTSSLPVPDWS